MPSPARKAKSLAFSALVAFGGALALASLLAVHVLVLLNGLPVVAAAGPSLMLPPPPPSASSLEGGIGPSLVGSLECVALALAISTPISLAVAVYAVEYPRSRLSRLVEVAYGAYYGFPTIVISMVVYSSFVVITGTQSLLAGAISLALVGIPLEASYMASALSSVPREYREAAYALGLRRHEVVRIVLGMARRFVATGLVMVAARLLGETSALLLTVGNALTSYPGGPMQPASTLTTLIFSYALSPYPVQAQLAWAASLVLYAISIGAALLSNALVRGVRA